MDLWCGVGHDVALASRLIQRIGSVIPLAMIEEMLAVVKENVERYAWDEHNCGQVAFICTVIDDPVDIAKKVEEHATKFVISNRVFNLIEDKSAAFAAAYRALKKGGWFLLSDAC